MLIRRSTSGTKLPLSREAESLLDAYTGDDLEDIVRSIARPRHFVAQAEENARIGGWLVAELSRCGYAAAITGECRTVVATAAAAPAQAQCIVGAHYDSVPSSPGADDNASGVAAVLSLARHLAGTPAATGIAFVLFNREEDGLLGSAEFVRSLPRPAAITECHVLEMIGFTARGLGSQRTPPGLPITIREEGDFLGLLSNSGSNRIANAVVDLVGAATPDLRVLALKTYLGIERHIPHLHRSDHSPFWQAGIPAVMWTDTSEFRNPHYHRSSDTPDTLDYGFLRQVSTLLLARLLTRSGSQEC